MFLKLDIIKKGITPAVFRATRPPLPHAAANMPQPVNDQCEIKRQIMDATGNDYHLDVAYKQIHMGG